jgi:hypothetical protein
LPVQPVGSRFDFSGHVVEGPAQGREFFLGVRLAAGAEGRRQERTLLD